MEELIKEMELYRIDVETECWNDKTGELRRRYERANEMLDDCINVVSSYFQCDNRNG